MMATRSFRWCFAHVPEMRRGSTLARSSYVPPACDGDFDDVPCPSLFADWIEQLAEEQITTGCGGPNYCPLNPNTRGQMAVFLTKTFNLQ